MLEARSWVINASSSAVGSIHRSDEVPKRDRLIVAGRHDVEVCDFGCSLGIGKKRCDSDDGDDKGEAKESRRWMSRSRII